MAKINIKRLLLAIGICEGVGIMGGVITAPAIGSWYSLLNKPSFNPPSGIFGPVWTLLYFLMGISLYLYWMKKGTNLKYFWLQLGLNFAWSIFFFGLHSPLLALVDILLLLATIILTIREFYKVSKPAGVLLIPYLAWVSFATFLNLAIWLLNY